MRLHGMGALAIDDAEFLVCFLQSQFSAPDPIKLEEKWRFTDASAGQLAGVAALAVANLVGVVVLGNLLQDPQLQYALAKSSLGFVGGLLPWLQVCLVLQFTTLRY